MRRARVVVAALALLVLAGTGIAVAAGALAPRIEPAAKGEHCVEDTATMRRDHPSMLRHQRDLTVHQGIRGAKYSLKGCIDCHASAKTNSVASAPGDFCVACHSYAAVSIDCFECHTSKPQAKVAKLP